MDVTEVTVLITPETSLTLALWLGGSTVEDGLRAGTGRPPNPCWGGAKRALATIFFFCSQKGDQAFRSNMPSSVKQWPLFNTNGFRERESVLMKSMRYKSGLESVKFFGAT